MGLCNLCVASHKVLCVVQRVVPAASHEVLYVLPLPVMKCYVCSRCTPNLCTRLLAAGHDQICSGLAFQTSCMSLLSHY